MMMMVSGQEANEVGSAEWLQPKLAVESRPRLSQTTDFPEGQGARPLLPSFPSLQFSLGSALRASSVVNKTAHSSGSSRVSSLIRLITMVSAALETLNGILVESHQGSSFENEVASMASYLWLSLAINQVSMYNDLTCHSG